MYLTAVSVNWGRGYDPGEFKRNVMNVLEFADGEHVALFVQELDEADSSPEHAIFGKMLEPHSKRVGWATHEPVILSPAFTARRKRVTLTMKSGLEIGAPAGTGPRRYAVTCVGHESRTGIELGFGNTHPHRNMPNAKVQAARRRGEDAFSDELCDVYNSRGGTSTIWGSDTNDMSFPRMIPGERTAKKRGLDVIRYKEHPRGAKLELLKTGTLNGTIDPHDPIWARFNVTARAA